MFHVIRYCTVLHQQQKKQQLTTYNKLQIFYLDDMVSKFVGMKCRKVNLMDSQSYVRDNVLSGGHYPKINPDGANNTPTRSGGVLFRPEGIYFWTMTDGQYIIPLIIR